MRRDGVPVTVAAVARRANVSRTFLYTNTSTDARTAIPAAITPVVTYPEAVDLARVLASPRWRHPTGRATKHGLRQFRCDINDRVGIHYNPQDSSADPLLRWFHKRHDPSQTAPPAALRR